MSLLSDSPDLSAPGYAVGVFHEGQIAEIVTVGARDVAANLPIDENTQFYVGSVSKQFTALALMQLVLAGLVRLDDDVRTYLPEMPCYEGSVSVDMLLHHTAGIREFLALVRLAGYPDYATASRSDALSLTLRQQGTDFPPGTRCHYSNGGYLLLSEIIERVAGTPFSRYVNQAVLAPLGMSRSYMLDGARPDADDANVAHGYQINEGQVTLSDSFPLFGGSGGLISTLADLARYDRDIDSGHRIWTPEISGLMLTPGRLPDGGVTVPDGLIGAYASGLMLGPAWISHGGAALGLKANYARLPEQRLGVVVLCNRGEIDLDERINAIVAAMDDELPPVIVTAPDIMLGRFRSDDLGVLYELSQKGGRMLKARILSGSDGSERKTLLLTRMDDQSFVGPDVRLTLDADGGSFVLQTPHVTLGFEQV